MKLPPLGEDRPAENPEVFEVTSEKTPRLLCQPEDPFRAASLHPPWRAFEVAGEKIDRGAYSHGNRHAQGTIMHRDPFLLFGTAERNEKQVWPRFENAALDFIVVHFQKLVERR